MKTAYVSTSRPLIRPSGTFSPRGEGGNETARHSLLPSGEKVPEGRMRGPHGTAFPCEGVI
ncbi:hypothetical protein FHT82_003037 [Rhizobium sp. BK275]|nr:hypothetical protein [Rhizobium sp. BK275]MBB3409262.1 hypothetical protein [Rhizobium sp. BK316]